MTKFGEKLKEIPESIDLFLGMDVSMLEMAFRNSIGKPVFAIGSGGSLVSAEYFCKCRETLKIGTTTVYTPLEFALCGLDLNQVDVWIFSANAKNPDTIASLKSARNRGCKNVTLVTTRKDINHMVDFIEDRLTICTIPIGNYTDGFLATHSLVGTVISLYLVSNNLALSSNDSAIEQVRSSVMKVLEKTTTSSEVVAFTELKTTDTIMALIDPKLSPIGTLLETCIWETSLCNIQLTDFRNFAHGRHTWFEIHKENTLFLALYGDCTKEMYARISNLIPTYVKKIGISFENCGRLQNAVGLIRCMNWIDAIGKSVGIDPSKPGVADFGRKMYSDNSLIELTDRQIPSIHHKIAAINKYNDSFRDHAKLPGYFKNYICRLSSANFGGIVLDYDGTIVSEVKCYSPPDAAFINEITRILKLGIKVSIVTGRGGSVGEELRKLIPIEFQSEIVMGYYNGGFIRPLNIDIRKKPPVTDLVFKKLHRSLISSVSVDTDDIFNLQYNQISIFKNNIKNIGKLLSIINDNEIMNTNCFKILNSQHSIDIIYASVSKNNVVNELHELQGENLRVLCIGDQGGVDGDDFEMLNHRYGISVREVCANVEGCWSLYGSVIQGPEATIRILKSLKQNSKGQIRIDLNELDLQYPKSTIRC